MASIEGEIVIGPPADVVFGYVADQSNEPQYNPRMVRAEKITAARREGTRFRSTVASIGRTGGNADGRDRLSRSDRGAG